MVEVQGVSPSGLWLFVEGTEYFIPFEAYPAFREAPVALVFHVELRHGIHLHWPDLDVDIDLEALVHPDRYPLTYRP